MGQKCNLGRLKASIKIRPWLCLIHVCGYGYFEEIFFSSQTGLGNFDTTRESNTNTTRIYRVWVYAITHLWHVNDPFMTHQSVYDTFMTRLQPIKPFMTYLWRVNDIFFTKLTKRVDMLTRQVDTLTRRVDTTTRIAKPTSNPMNLDSLHLNPFHFV
jgi:hypothetical protein